MEKGILDEQVINMEILEFKAGGNFYGININDVKEILPYNKKPTPVPNSHPFLEGLIMPRDFLIPIIDMVKSLNLTDLDDFKNEMLIITEFYDSNIAFHVDSVLGIHRVTSSNLSKPGKKLSTTVKNAVSSVLSIDDKKIELLDFKKIISDINANIG
jgi:two-component system chemotaxis response regulator CheV